MIAASNAFKRTKWQTRKSKRRKVTLKSRAKAVTVKTEERTQPHWSADPLLRALHKQTAEDWEGDADRRDSFEEIIEPLLPDLLHADSTFFQREGEGYEQVSSALVYADLLVCTRCSDLGITLDMGQ